MHLLKSAKWAPQLVQIRRLDGGHVEALAAPRRMLTPEVLDLELPPRLPAQ